ncbi:MAG: PilZ domain-containing protein [Candidatus Omnitrophica bacterium]|nr:PilZ domain-containing protein [Candidatus Omnitrophota bacterium]
MGRRKKFTGKERRKFIRLDYTAPLALKVCKKETVSKILDGYTSDVSQAGLLCNIKDKVKINDILWISFDRATLNICGEIEKNSFIYQGGIVGKVVRITRAPGGFYSVGVQFMTREEKNITNIFPQIKFLRRRKKIPPVIEDTAEEEHSPEPLEEIEIGDRHHKNKPVEPETAEDETDKDFKDEET